MIMAPSLTCIGCPLAPRGMGSLRRVLAYDEIRMMEPKPAKFMHSIEHQALLDFQGSGKPP